MRQLRPLLAKAFAPRRVAFVLCAFILFAVGNVAQAQSGRRTPKPLPPEPTPPPSSEPAVKKPAAKPDAPRLSLILSIDERSSFMYLPLYFYQAAMDGCLSRMRESSDVKVTADKEMSRGEAVKRAKAQTEAFVVWLQIESDSMGQTRAEDLFVHYTVFSPGTAKIKTDGRAYQGQNRRGTIGGPPIRSGGLYTEYLLKEAGRYAADRVLAALGASSPAERTTVPTFPFSAGK